MTGAVAVSTRQWIGSRPRPFCKRDADPKGLKADRDGDHVANALAWLRMRQIKAYWRRKAAGSEFRVKPQQPGPACGACPCRKEPRADGRNFGRHTDYSALCFLCA